VDAKHHNSKKVEEFQEPVLTFQLLQNLTDGWVKHEELDCLHKFHHFEQFPNPWQPQNLQNRGVAEET